MTSQQMKLWLWSLLPVGMLVFHYGPGEGLRQHDAVAAELAAAKEAEAAKAWGQAIIHYDEALKDVGKTDLTTAWQIRLHKARARVNTPDIASGLHAMELLGGEISAQEPDSPLLDEVRFQTATAAYYAAWIMRLEGAPRPLWLADADAARQRFKVLAEGDLTATVGSSAQRNLEAATRLIHMDLDALRALGLPEEGSGRGSKGVGEKRAQQKGEGEGQGEGEGEGEGQGEGEGPPDSRGMGRGERPEGIGS